MQIITSKEALYYLEEIKNYEEKINYEEKQLSEHDQIYYAAITTMYSRDEAFKLYTNCFVRMYSKITLRDDFKEIFNKLCNVLEQFEIDNDL